MRRNYSPNPTPFFYFQTQSPIPTTQPDHLSLPPNPTNQRNYQTLPPILTTQPDHPSILPNPTTHPYYQTHPPNPTTHRYDPTLRPNPTTEDYLNEFNWNTACQMVDNLVNDDNDEINRGQPRGDPNGAAGFGNVRGYQNFATLPGGANVWSNPQDSVRIVSQDEPVPFIANGQLHPEVARPVPLPSPVINRPAIADVTSHLSTSSAPIRSNAELSTFFGQQQGGSSGMNMGQYGASEARMQPVASQQFVNTGMYGNGQLSGAMDHLSLNPHTTRHLSLRPSHTNGMELDSNRLNGLRSLPTGGEFRSLGTNFKPVSQNFPLTNTVMPDSLNANCMHLASDTMLREEERSDALLQDILTRDTTIRNQWQEQYTVEVCDRTNSWVNQHYSQGFQPMRQRLPAVPPMRQSDPVVQPRQNPCIGGPGGIPIWSRGGQVPGESANPNYDSPSTSAYDFNEDWMIPR